MQQALKLNIPQSSCNPYLTYLPPVSFLSKYIDSSRRYLPATSVGALPTVAVNLCRLIQSVHYPPLPSVHWRRYFLRNLGSLCIKKAAQSILCGLLSYITLSFASLELVHSGASLYQSIAPTVIVHSAAVAYSAVFVQTHGYASPDFPEFAFLPTLFCFCNKKESIAIVNWRCFWLFFISRSLY